MYLDGVQLSLPKLSRTNFSSSFLTLPTGKITFGELKSLEPDLSENELKLLASTMGSDVDPATANWIVDSVMDGIFLRISDIENTGTISVGAQEVLQLFRGADTSLMFSNMSHDFKDYYDWSTIKRVLIPFNKDENHWILLAMEPNKKIITGNTLLLHFIVKTRSMKLN